MLPPSRRFFAQINAPRPEEDQTAAWLHHTNGQGFVARQLDARTNRDTVRLAACFEAALRHGELGADRVRQHWARLLTLGRWDDAIDLMRRPGHLADDPEYWLALATALAGSGGLAEAAEAAAKVREGSSEQARADALRRQASRVLKAEQRAGKIAGWAEMLEVVDACFELGSVARAIPWLIRAAGLADLDTAGAAEVLTRTEAILPSSGPGEALDLLLALRPIAERREAASLIEVTARILVGEAPAETATLARGDQDIEFCCGLALAAAGVWRGAIPVLGRIAVRQGAADRARLPLAHTVGREIIETVRPSFRPAARRKIVDLFPFFDELVLLRLRLEEMADWVDHFVILEANQTFTGNPKPLHFQEHRAAFARFSEKIIHVPVEFPAHIDTPWAREFYQRDIALRTLAGLCGEDDLVLVTDVDEILKREAIEGFERQYAYFDMPTYAYYFNLLQVEDGRRVRGAVWRAKYLQQIGLSAARLALLAYDKKARIDGAGWHFTSIRDAADLPSKFRSYSHTNHARLTAAYFEALMERIQAGREPGLVRCELDDSFPRSLLDGRERLKPFLL